MQRLFLKRYALQQTQLFARLVGHNVVKSATGFEIQAKREFDKLLELQGNGGTGSMHVVGPSVVCICVLPRRSSQRNYSARIPTYFLFGCDCMSGFKNQLCRFQHFSFRQKHKVINGQRFRRRFPQHPPFYLCWTILVGCISSVKWTGAQSVALRLGVIVFAQF